MKFFPVKTVFSSLSSDKQLKRTIKNIFGYKPGNIYLYRLAFLHRSATQENIQGIKINNERLEFLGDAILDAVTADFLFKTFPTRDEGFLTEMRSKIVSRAQLNKLSQKMGLDVLIQLEGTSPGMLRSFRGDALEALIGAMYLDKGYEFTKKILLERFINHYFNMDDLVNQEMNFKSKILEWAQKDKKQIQFLILDEVGTGHKKQYIIELVIDEKPLARGQDYSIKGAEQQAAEKAWQKITEENS